MFRKSFLLLAFVWGSLAQAQDFRNSQKSSNDLLQPHLIGMSYKKKNSQKTPNLKLTPFWSDNFDNPSDWVIGKIDSASSGDWRIDSLGPIGNFSGQMGIISSSSGGNCAIFDSDDESFSNNFPDATLTTANSINCSSHSMVRLTFESYYAYFSYNEIYVEISNNGTTWNSIQIHPSNVAGIYTDNPETISINISPYAANEPTVWIRFRHKGEWEYAWMVDDVELEDFQITDALVFDGSFTGDDFSTRPLSQLPATISFEGNMINFGANSFNASMLLDIKDSTATSIFSSASTGANLNAGDSAAMPFSTSLNSSILGSGYHSVFMTSNVSGDIDLTNNSVDIPMFVSDSMLIRTQNFTTYNFGWIGGLQHAERFELIHPDTLSGAQAWLRFSDTLGAPNSLVGMQVNMELWQELGDTPSVKLADFKPYTITASDTIGSSGDTSYYPIYFQVDSGYLGASYNSGISLNAGSYFLVLKEPSNSPGLAMPMMSYEYTADNNTYALLTNGQWFDYTDYVDVSASSVNYNYSLAMSAVLSEPTTPLICSLSTTVISTPTSGPLATDGSASVTQVINGAPPYTYMWSNGGSNTTINNIGVGSYYVVVSDTLGCRDTTYVNIWDSCLLTLSGVVTDASVPGASDGAIDVTVSGASSPVFLWSNLATTEDLNNIPQGIYTVYVDDSLGCADSMTFIVGAASCNLQVLGNITNESSFGANDGAISVSVSNGIAPYTYSWSNGASSSSLSNLAPGSYILTVMDSVGCMVIDTFDVLPFLCKQMSIDSVLIINSTGPTGTNGSIHLIVSGTPGPFSYLWSNGQTGSSLTNVAAGNYCVTITDDSVGCIIDTCYSVGQDSCNMSLTSQVNHESGPSANDGSIILTPVGGTAPYSYSWSPNVFNNSSGANNLTPGVYSYTITDDAGCQAIGYDTINDFCDLSVTGIAYPTIPNQSNGWIDITVSGGAAPYVYTWSPGGQTTEDISGLDIGNYNVQVRDSNGCVVNALFGVEASPLSIEELGTVDRFNVYPNPTSDMINVRLLSSTGKGIYKINIRNMLGELLFSDIRYISNEAMTFDISLLQSGLYLMEFDDQKNYQTVVPIILK